VDRLCMSTMSRRTRSSPAMLSALETESESALRRRWAIASAGGRQDKVKIGPLVRMVIFDSDADIIANPECGQTELWSKEGTGSVKSTIETRPVGERVTTAIEFG